MGTMAHEITHNLHSAHSAEFYKYLDQVLEDYDEMKRTGEVRGLDKVSGGVERLGERALLRKPLTSKVYTGTCAADSAD